MVSFFYLRDIKEEEKYFQRFSLKVCHTQFYLVPLKVLTLYVKIFKIREDMMMNVHLQNNKDKSKKIIT